jgi:hypothetical protein
MKGPVYKYTWKHEIAFATTKQLEFRKAPLQPGMIFVDLLNGKAYRVHSIFKAKENDRFHSAMPEDVVQTFPARPLTDNELTALRERYKFQPDQNTGPGEEFAILDLVTTQVE